MAKQLPQTMSLKAWEGRFRTTAVSGLLTGVAAATATAGHIFVVRWAPTAGQRARVFVPVQIAVRMKEVSGFTAAQEFGFDVVALRSFTASYTTGTALTLTGNNAKKHTVGPTSLVADMRISATAALTVGTQTLDAQPFMADSVSSLAAGATIYHQATAQYIYTADEDDPLWFETNEGFVVRNSIAMGAGGTCRLFVDIDWLELERY